MVQSGYGTRKEQFRGDGRATRQHGNTGIIDPTQHTPRSSLHHEGDLVACYAGDIAQ